MEYSIYQCVFDTEFKLKKTSNSLSENLKSKLDLIEIEIINEYLKKQKGKTGIRTLGNEIRYNKLIQNQFGKIENNEILFKMTEHARSFLSFFCDKLANVKDINIYFLILSKQFGLSSKIVDKSFPCKADLSEQISNLVSSFEMKINNREIFFIEIKSFQNYYFEKIDEKYSKIHKFTS